MSRAMVMGRGDQKMDIDENKESHNKVMVSRKRIETSRPTAANEPAQARERKD